MWALVFDAVKESSLEAILNGGCEWGLVLDSFFELVKFGDLYSDIMFIITLSKFESVLGDVNDAADEYTSVPATAILISTVAFTVVGFVFQAMNFLIMCVVRRRRQRENHPAYDKERGRKKRDCWAQINWCLEDLPQFLILSFFIGLISSDDFLPCFSYLDESGTTPPGFVDQCSDEQREYISQVEMDGMISFVFTCVTTSRAIKFCRTACRNGTCFICCERENEQVTLPGSSDEGDVGRPHEDEAHWQQGTGHPQAHWQQGTGHPQEAQASWEEDTSQELHDYEYSKTIRTETLNPDGSITVTVTKTFRNDDSNGYEI